MKRGFCFQWLALCAVIAVCAAAAAAGGAGAGPTARERAREMRLQEARMQVEVAREALAIAQRMVEENMAPSMGVGERALDVMRAERALAELMATEVERVSIDVKDEKLTAVFAKLFEGTGQSLVLDPAIAELPHSVTLTLTDVSLESAVRAICKLYNLEYETDNDGLWVIMPGSGFVTVGGARVPIMGMVTSLPGPQGGETEVAQAIRRVFAGGGGGGGGRVREARNRPSFVGEERLVDLDVKDAPLSEVASRLSFRADPQPRVGPRGSWRPETYNVEIIADDAVKDLKVTASIARWPLGEVLDMLLAQTGLVCTVDAPGRMVARTQGGERVSRHLEIRKDPATGEPVSTIRVYLVPAPELRVSGIRLSGGGGGPGFQEALQRPSFFGDDRLVDLDVKDAPLNEVASRLSFKADPQPTTTPLPPEGSETYNLEIIAGDAVKDLKVTAKIAKWPLGEVLDMLLSQTGLVCTVDAPAGGRVGHRTASGGVVFRLYDVPPDPATGEPVYPTVRVYIVPAPGMRVSGEGLPSEALVSRSMALIRAAGGRADEVRVLQFPQECPKCHATILLPDWTFCPYCGAEAVGEVGRPEGGD